MREKSYFFRANETIIGESAEKCAMAKLYKERVSMMNGRDVAF